MLRSKLVLGTLIGLLVLATMSFVFRQINRSYLPHKLTIAAGSPGGDSHDFAVALREILKEEKPPIELEIVPESEVDIATMVQDHNADLGVLQLDKESYSEVRLIVLIYPELFFLVVHRDSDIRSPADLAGKVVATDEAVFEDVLKYYGIPQDKKVTWRKLDSDKAHIAFVNREVDAVFRWSEPTTDRVKRLVQEGQGRLIPFDQFESMRLTTPYLAEYVLPPGLYQAGNPAVPAANLKTVGSYKALVANADVDPAIIQRITQAIFEHQNTLVSNFPLAVYLRSPTDTQMVGPYIHPGAQTYYDKDKPTFFQRYESEISFVFSAGPILASVLLALWAKMRSKQQNRAKLHIQAVHNALMRLSETPNGQGTDAVEQRLVKILAQFTKDLNDGNINAEDAQTFSLIWDKAITITRDRKKLADLSIS